MQRIRQRPTGTMTWGVFFSLRAARNDSRLDVPLSVSFPRLVLFRRQALKDRQELRGRLRGHVLAAQLDRERVPAPLVDPEHLVRDGVRGRPETLLRDALEQGCVRQR